MEVDNSVMIPLTDIELAVKFLKIRSKKTEESPDLFLASLLKVNPLHEVEAVFDMVKKGTFTDFYKKQEAAGMLF